MRVLTIILGILIAGTAASAQSVQGILDLVKRRLPNHVAKFTFSIVNATAASPSKHNDEYTVSRSANGKILVEGNSLSGLSIGLHRYLTDVVHVDIYWYIGSQMHLAPVILPQPNSPLKGSSIVPWKYHFNTGKSFTGRNSLSYPWNFPLSLIIIRAPTAYIIGAIAY